MSTKSTMRIIALPVRKPLAGQLYTSNHYSRPLEMQFQSMHDFTEEWTLETISEAAQVCDRTQKLYSTAEFVSRL